MFDRLPISTPFQIGPVNAYIAGRTVVDPGPNSEEAWTALIEGLAAHDLTPTDVMQVIVTHPHPDHFGLAARLREAGAQVVAGAGGAHIMEDFEGQYEHERSFFTDFFVDHGMDHNTAETVIDLPEGFLQYAPSVTVDVTLTEGDTLPVADIETTARTTTGHALEELLLTYETDSQQRAIVGDHVLAEITPNPMLQPPQDGGRRPRMLPAYNRSLATLREADFDYLLTGHRDPIDDPVGRIDAMLAAHDERTERVYGLLDEPSTAFTVMEGLFPDIPATEYFPGMSEAVGHLDVLVERNAVVRREQDDWIVFERD